MRPKGWKEKRTPLRTFRDASSGTKPIRTDDRSRPSSIAACTTSSASTPNITVARSRSISSAPRRASKASVKTSVPALTSVVIRPQMLPPPWKKGIMLNHTSPSRIPMRRECSVALATIPPCSSITPFGNPVLPEVYLTIPRSLPRTATCMRSARLRASPAPALRPSPSRAARS